MYTDKVFQVDGAETEEAREEKLLVKLWCRIVWRDLC